MLNPLAIAHLGIARRPIVAALLGIWDELMAELAARPRRGTGYFKSEPRAVNRRRLAVPKRDLPRQRRRQQEDELLLLGL